ncbi:hypothetical protein [Salinigranum halophilum]|uniref:hypothetical protein n=1 Tax=Salinigranum halophilum TaxID=2565931 RepID=UPI0010A7CB1D
MKVGQLNRRSVLKTLSTSVFFGTATVGRTAARTDTTSPTDLGVLEDSSRADDINANGTIVGRSRKTIDGTSYHRAVRWPDPTSIEDLGTLRDDNAGSSFAHGINNRGTIVGAAQDDA